MRTLIVISAGLLAVMTLFRVLPPRIRAIGLGVFTVAWAGLTAMNLRTGLSRGYTLAEELPIHALLFCVPVLTAWIWHALVQRAAKRA